MARKDVGEIGSGDEKGRVGKGTDPRIFLKHGYAYVIVKYTVEIAFTYR